jgi:hypothetical protein
MDPFGLETIPVRVDPGNLVPAPVPFDPVPAPIAVPGLGRPLVLGPPPTPADMFGPPLGAPPPMLDYAPLEASPEAYTDDLEEAGCADEQRYYGGFFDEWVLGWTTRVDPEPIALPLPPVETRLGLVYRDTSGAARWKGIPGRLVDGEFVQDDTGVMYFVEPSTGELSADALASLMGWWGGKIVWRVEGRVVIRTLRRYAGRAAREGCEHVGSTPWSGMSGRTLRGWVESLENTGRRLDAEQLRELLPYLQRHGWRVVRGTETNWVGGPHIHIVGPGGGPNVHLPVPPGFTP